MKNFIPLKVHNVLDYLGGATLLLLPTLFGFSDVEVANTFCMIMGVSLLAYSAVTNYRYSLINVIPLGVHMTLDAIAGSLILIAPWFLGYEYALTTGQIWAHVIAGGGLLAVVAFTRPLTERARRTGGTEASDSYEIRDEISRAA